MAFGVLLRKQPRSLVGAEQQQLQFGGKLAASRVAASSTDERPVFRKEQERRQRAAPLRSLPVLPDRLPVPGRRRRGGGHQWQLRRRGQAQEEAASEAAGQEEWRGEGAANGSLPERLLHQRQHEHRPGGLLLRVCGREFLVRRVAVRFRRKLFSHHRADVSEGAGGTDRIFARRRSLSASNRRLRSHSLQRQGGDSGPGAPSARARCTVARALY